MHEQNPQQPNGQRETPQQRRECLLDLMQQAALILPKDLFPEVQALYLKALDGLSVSELRYAFDQALTRCEFFPVPKTILEFASEYRKSPAHQQRLEAIEAEMHARYKQRQLSGEPQKHLVSILEFPEQTFDALQKHPRFQSLVRRTNMGFRQRTEDQEKQA